MEIIQEIGSYAGLAAIVGLAVLSALYFSQARDVRRLRDWAGKAPERTSEPAAQPTRVVARPVPRPPSATPSGLGTAGQPAPGGAAAASAVGAASAVALGPAAATPAAARVSGNGEEGRDSTEGVSQDTMAHAPPLPDEEDSDDHGSELEGDEQERGLTEDSPGVVEDSEPDDEDALRHDGDDLDRDDDRDHDDDLEHDDDVDHDDGDLDHDDEHEDDWDDYDEETGDRPAVTPPLPTAGSPVRPVPPPPRTAPATPAGARPAAVAASRPSNASGSPILPPYDRSRPGGNAGYRRFFYSPQRAALVIGLGVLVLAAATLGGLRLAGGDDQADTPAAGQTGAAGQPTGGQGGGGAGNGADDQQPAVDPSQVTVAVLNGTTVTGLAADVGDLVEKEGYQLGNVTNSLERERAESVVFYAPGAEAEAEDVSRRLKITQREEIDPDTQALAGDASVVVVVGADKT